MSDDFKLNNFDLLRIFAASQVLVGHSIFHLGLEQPSWYLPFSVLPGVPIFFVISGFLISAAWERSGSVSAYAEARILRIFPALWCCVGLTVLVFSAMGVDFARWQTLPWLASQSVGLIYTPSFLRDFGMGSYNGSLWTIPVELQFYFMLPIVYWAMARAGGSLRLLVALTVAFAGLAFLTRWVFPSFGTHHEGGGEPLLEKLIRYSFLPHFFMFLAGVLMQRLRVWQWSWIRGKGAFWLAAYMLVAFTVPPLPLTTVSAMLLLAVTTVSFAYTRPELAEKLLRRNDISYGVYIYHGLLLNVFLELGWRGEARYSLALCFGTVVMAWFSWRWVERPCLRLKGRRALRRTELAGEAR